MAIDKDKIQIANLTLQYLSNIHSIVNAQARGEALKIISRETGTPVEKLSFADMFRTVFDEIETLCSDDSEQNKPKT